MPASAEDLKARVRRAQRRARRERARKKALLGPAWGLPASVEASLDRKKTLAALNREGGPMPGARTSDQARRAIEAASEVAKAEAIKARARREKRDLTFEETRRVADLNRDALAIANAGPGNPGENALTLFVGPSVASWLRGGIPRQGGWENLALEAALFALPTKGIGRIVGRGAKAAGIPTRTLAARGFEATIPAARSIPGRAIERGIDRLTPEKWMLRRIASETARTSTTRARVIGAPAAAAANTGRRLNVGQWKALQILNDGVPLTAQTTRHQGWLDDAIRAGDKKKEILHRIHLRLIEKAGRWLDDTPAGPALKPTAPARLRETWGLVQKSGDTRSEIIERLGLLAEDTIRARVSKPGRVMLGAAWDKTDEALKGFEGFTGGGTYLPDVRGVPGMQPHTIRSLTRQAQVYARGGWRRRISGKAIYPELTHEYTGLLRQSGLFRTDVHNLTHDSLARALKLDTIRWYRDKLLSGATDVPRYVDDVPIAVRPGGRVQPELKEFWDTWEMVQGGGLTAKQVGDLAGDKQLDEYLRALFPRNVSPVGKPIDGIKWVPRELVQNSAVTNPLAGRMFGTGDVAKAVGGTFDLVNDYVKAAILFGNPAYSPVQLVQNVALNVIHQGVFLPRNWAQAARLLAKLAPENKQVILDATQAGHASVLQARKLPINKAAKVAMFIADRYPRLAAFAHEAAKAGYKTSAEIDALITAARKGTPGAMEQFDLIIRRGVDAVGDFERLGPVEKNTLARWLFVYPWLKAATRLTYRMPLDHPWQSIAIGAAGYELKERSDRMLGDRPHYAEWEIPIPGQTDEHGNPYTFNISRLFPWETPASIVRAGISAATGLEPQGPQALDLLQPTIQAGISAITGRDDFSRDVGKGLPAFARETWEALPPARFHHAFTTSEEEKREKMFPRDTQDELIRLGAGSLAPKPYNIEKAQAIAQGKTRTSGSYVRQAMRELKQFIAENPGQINTSYYPLTAFQTALEIRARVSDKQFEMRRNQKAKELTERQEYAAKLSVLQELRPELGIDGQTWQVFRQWFETASGDDLDGYKTRINGLLELEDVYGRRLLSTLSRVRSEARDRERERKLGITGG